MSGSLAPIGHRGPVAVLPKPAIGQAAEKRLRASGYLALRDVSCIASGGVACLYGRVPSYYLKQLAQEIAAQVVGVRIVVNKIDVRAPARPGRANTRCPEPANDSFSTWLQESPKRGD